DINLDRTFFTCTSLSFQPGVTTKSGQHFNKLNPEGCTVIYARIHRRLAAVGLSLRDLLCMFTNPGERELVAEQWLDVASTLPLGVSRAEMQQLFAKMDAEGSGKVPVDALQSAVSRAPAASCSTAPPWISAAMQRGLCAQIRDALSQLREPGPNGAVALARESDFRRVVMQTERYLTSDQLNSLVLLADKSADGHVDYEEFAERFGGGGVAALQVPGRVLPSICQPLPGVAQPTDEEVYAVASRTAHVLERHGLPPDRLPALVALWGGGLGTRQRSGRGASASARSRRAPRPAGAPRPSRRGSPSCSPRGRGGRSASGRPPTSQAPRSAWCCSARSSRPRAARWSPRSSSARWWRLACSLGAPRPRCGLRRRPRRATSASRSSCRASAARRRRRRRRREGCSGASWGGESPSWRRLG
ncbi:unnamed protein product, partial [Prorocentrum cordatum]